MTCAVRGQNSEENMSKDIIIGCQHYAHLGVDKLHYYITMIDCNGPS